MIQLNRQNSIVANWSVAILIFSVLLLSYLPGGSRINFIVGIVFVLVILLISLGGNRKIKLEREIVLLFAWLAYGILPSIFALSPGASLSKLFTMFQLAVMAILLINTIVWSRKIKFFMWCYVLAALTSYLISFTGLSEVKLDERSVGQVAGRTVGTLRNANTFAIVVLQAQFYLAYIFISSRHQMERLLALGIALAFSLAILSSGSRTGILGLAVLGLGVGWVYKAWNPARPKIFLSYLFAIIAILAALVYSYQQDEIIQNRLAAVVDIVSTGDLSNEGSSHSIRGRAELASMALETALTYPFGVGFNNFDRIAGTYAHSNVLEILASTGFPGLLLYYTIYLSLFFKIRKQGSLESGQNKLIARVLFLLPAILIMTDLTNVSYYSKDVWISLAILIGTLKVMKIDAFQRKK